ncbi:MAG: ABC transporter ATP-binding protein [Chloroflexi bacterium]|nr:MAG: ABC transporter ATP-binding protein [Chloroflexota bacterium]
MKLPLKQYWALLKQYLKPQWRNATLLAILLLTHIGLRLVNPQVMRFFIDTAVSQGPLSTLINAALLFLGIATINQILSLSNTYLGEQVAWTATNALRHDLLRHVLRLDQSFHKQHTSGEMLERIDGDVNALSNFFSRFAVFVVGNLLLIVGILVLLWRENGWLGFVWSSFTIIWLAAMIWLRGLAIQHWEKVRGFSGKFYGFLSEQLAATEDIRANGAVNFVLHRVDVMFGDWFRTQLKANKVANNMWSASIVLFAIANGITYVICAALFFNGRITIGTAYILILYANLIQDPMIQLRNQLENLQKAEASIQRIRELLAIETKLVDGNGRSLPTAPLTLNVHDLTFSYEADDLVLQNISFQLQQGRILGLLGRTGSGKTTLARLILRLYDPISGSITLDGVAPPTQQLAHWRTHVAMVTQDVQLFRASIRENLTFFNPHIADADILETLADLGLSEWLETQEYGLDTVLSSGRGSLSAGQGQLLAFARVFLTNPGLIILDEASSRLDPATEHLIERSLDRLLHNRTGIIIAHHLATVQRADDILILENGRILEYGSRHQLATNPQSRFAQLLQTGLEDVLV